jgi:hypothetical protein
MPCAVATRPAISRIVLRSAAIHFVKNRSSQTRSNALNLFNNGEADLRAEPLPLQALGNLDGPRTTPAVWSAAT